MKPPRLGDAILGVVYLVLIGLFLLVAMAAYNKTFVDTTTVKLTTGTIGNALQSGSDVKLHGVPVGTVKNVSTSADGATLTLSLDPATAKALPADTTARLLPKTLFGERFVSLILPSPATGVGTISAGDTIVQDTSDQAVELEEVFDELLPLLKSIQPEKLSSMLGEMATTLRGRGEDIGDSLEVWNRYLLKLNPLVPTMTEDLNKLASVASTYNEAVPDLLSALDSFTVTTNTVLKERTALADVYASVIASSDITTGWVTDNQNTIEILSSESRAALEATAPYASQFPCLLKAARQFIPVMDKTLGKGTSEPGIHVRLNVVESRGKYLPGKDSVQYANGGKPRCPYVTGQTGTKPASSKVLASKVNKKTAKEPTVNSDPATIAPPPAPTMSGLAATGLGDANSPAENQLISELLAPTQAMAPSEYPDWGSLLVGPTLRNTKVTLS